MFKLTSFIDKRSLGLFKYSSEETEYLYARIQAARARICDFGCVLSIVVDLTIMFMQPLAAEGTWFHFITKNIYICAILWFVGLKLCTSSNAKQRMMALNCILTFFLASLVMTDLSGVIIREEIAQKGLGFKGAIGTSLIISSTLTACSLVVIISWIDRALLLLMMAGFTGIHLVLSQVVAEPFIAALGLLGALLMGSLNHLLHLSLIRIEERELHMRLTTMPKRMAISLSDQDEKPKGRFCICLSSDWRDYQDLVSGLSDQTVADYLSDYYQRVQGLLAIELDGLDYYLDWIADELFLVIYSDETSAVNLKARQQMALKALSASQKILLMKEQYAKDRGFALKIDIGISAGQSLIGVLGPSNHRKATALGSTPGRSRRMQACGKLLREELSSEDRIIFGDEVLIVLSAPDPSGLIADKFAVGDRKLRNMDDKFLYFVTTSHTLEKNETDGFNEHYVEIAS